MKSYICKIETVAALLGLTPELITLPNKKQVTQIVWKPEHLARVFQACDGLRAQEGLGRGDLVTIDGGCPAWLLTTISHAFHPCSTEVRYKQGEKQGVLPVSGCEVKGEGKATGATLKVTKTEACTTVEFSLDAPTVDVEALLLSLVAPEVPEGIPVVVTGKGPISIAAAIAESYSHKVPCVACFQPGTGRVVSISHDASRPLGTLLS